MNVLGFAVSVNDSKATALGVLVDDYSGLVAVVDKFNFTNDGADLATRLYDMAEAVRTLVDSLKPDRVIVRRADFPPRGSRADGPKVRLLFEGAIVAAARHKCAQTHLGTGQDLGVWCGSDKTTVESDAKGLVKTSGLAQKYAVAAAAALAGLSHP